MTKGDYENGSCCCGTRSISEIAETDEIKELRKLNQELNEMSYAKGGIYSLSFTLLGVCDQKIYIGKEAELYYDILDTRDFLKEKYAELSNAEAEKHKEDVEEALEEADEVLRYIENRFNE